MLFGIGTQADSVALLSIGLLVSALKEGIQVCSYLRTVTVNLNAALEVGAFFDAELAGG